MGLVRTHGRPTPASHAGPDACLQREPRLRCSAGAGYASPRGHSPPATPPEECKGDKCVVQYRSPWPFRLLAPEIASMRTTAGAVTTPSGG